METIISWREARAHLCGRGKPEGSSMLKRIGQVLLLVVIFSTTFGICRLTTAQEWGSIKGRIIVENDPPKLPMINVPAFGLKLPNESVVLGEDKELVNAVVYLRVARGASPMAVHPEYEATIKKPIELDHKGFRFVPRIILARKGQTLEITNSDPVQYNIHIYLLSLNRLVPQNGRIAANVNMTSPVPVPVVSNVHPWMRAYLLALDHPYAAVTGQDGRFEIKNVPAGEREFEFWHEKTGYLKSVRTKAGETDTRGRIKFEIKAGETLDLGDIKVRI
jgi:hypothetical protein